ncbi:MAG: carbohydrate kinase family protein, partial [Solobacterium sp.]|nr:carbohydrate kinase family protein [Solobacterium sp.]
MKEYDVLCVGIATMDTIVEGVHKDSFIMDSSVMKDIQMYPGGDALNAAIHFSRLGLSCCLCACMGNDLYQEVLSDLLKKEGVDIQYLMSKNGAHTSSPIILVDVDGERHVLRPSNSANHFLLESDISDEAIKRSKHLHFASANGLKGLKGKDLARLFSRAKEYGLSTSMDATYDVNVKGIEEIEETLNYMDIFIPSLEEAICFSGKKEIEEIVSFFHQYPLKIFGIKLGKEGLYITDFKESYHLDSLYEEEVVDTTGAGDAFYAGFIAAYLKGYDIKSSAYLGLAQSASVLRGLGATSLAFYEQDAKEFIKEK